jgi:hypothetical protein
MTSGSIATMTDRRRAKADKETAKSEEQRATSEIEMLFASPFALSNSSGILGRPQEGVFKVRFTLASELRCNG